MHDHKEERRAKGKVDHQNILVGKMGCTIKASENLTWAEFVSMVVSMTLDSAADG